MTTARPMRADARRNHERIVAVAREAFAEHGVEASLDEIARRAEVGPGTLYRHFPQRQALMEAVYRDDVAGLSRRAQELLDEYPPGDALAQWLREQVDYLVRRRGLASTLKATLGPDSETFAACKAMLTGAASALLTAGQEAGVVRSDLTPRDVLVLAHGIGTAAEAAPDSFETLLGVAVEGLRAR
ncbi:TetR family transcriptional regulator [Haloactinopolyspora alba]|uniref:TetR family transcriptional regulator n=1 Tax=Haloactinopolyspora alba TaxID=648780 RepID=A0A2P8E9C7_9ACTN|nr:TetR/AcrR family transcriptional regulator [Haloactinopolyspora alba]PSL06079.1 TetR family transcriptional regulator [Haloactinopolyspora alba]